MLKGSCACGSIEYVINGSLIGPVTYCHCWRCRKHSGSSFGTTAGVNAHDLTFTRGEHLLSSWESSPGILRYLVSAAVRRYSSTKRLIPMFMDFVWAHSMSTHNFS